MSKETLGALVSEVFKAQLSQALCLVSRGIRVGCTLRRKLQTSQGPFAPEQSYLVTLSINTGFGSEWNAVGPGLAFPLVFH